MIVTLIQIAVLAAAASYFRHWRASVRRRNAQSWDSLVSRLRPDWSSRELDHGLFSQEGQNATPEEKWKSVQGAHGLWAMYQNACVMMEMADYAARNSDTVDRELLEALRSDAMQIRVSVVVALARYACSQVNEGICVNAFRAASMYQEMADRMRQLLEVNAAGMVPSFVAAM
jgi:hypothetical protein